MDRRVTLTRRAEKDYPPRMRPVTFIVVGALLGIACRKSAPPEPAAAPAASSKPLLSHDEVAKRVEQRIGVAAPGTVVKHPSPATLELRFPDGSLAEFSLETAYAVCGHRPADCDAYVDKLVNSLQANEDEEEDSDDGE
jgi:hypothetical protein